MKHKQARRVQKGRFSTRRWLKWVAQRMGQRWRLTETGGEE